LKTIVSGAVLNQVQKVRSLSFSWLNQLHYFPPPSRCYIS